MEWKGRESMEEKRREGKGSAEWLQEAMYRKKRNNGEMRQKFDTKREEREDNTGGGRKSHENR